MNIIEWTDKGIIKIAEPILDTIIQGTNQKNYELFTTHMTASMKTDNDKKIIEAQWSDKTLPCNLNLKRELLSILRKQDCVLIVWKAKCIDVADDLLHMLYLQSQSDGVKVIGTWIR